MFRHADRRLAGFRAVAAVHRPEEPSHLHALCSWTPGTRRFADINRKRSLSGRAGNRFSTGAALAVAAAMQTWSRMTGTPIRPLVRTHIR